MKIALYVLIGVLVLFLIVAITISSTAFSKFQEACLSLEGKSNSSFTTAWAFAQVLQQNKFKNRIALKTREGTFNDAYNYINKTVYLCTSTCSSMSIASLAIVAHEFGHAVQDFQNSKSFQKFMKMRRSVAISSRFISPLFLVGVILAFFDNDTLLYAGIACAAVGIFLFFVLLLFKVRLMKVEKEASKLGLELLREFDVLDEYEMKQAKHVLDRAFMTYLADFFRAMLSWTMLTNKSSKP